jgi:hypothetical protein
VDLGTFLGQAFVALLVVSVVGFVASVPVLIGLLVVQAISRDKTHFGPVRWCVGVMLFFAVVIVLAIVWFSS